jgi:hypothetical protein
MRIPNQIKICLALVGSMGLMAGVLLCTVTGCSTVAPGQDPLVVRAQQAETNAYSTFDFFLKVDNNNRAFFIANAPAVHAFAEQLRQPVMDGTNQTRLGLLWITQLDRITQAYISGGGSSNAVEASIATISSAATAAALDVTVFATLGANTNLP